MSEKKERDEAENLRLEIKEDFASISKTLLDKDFKSKWEKEVKLAAMPSVSPPKMVKPIQQQLADSFTAQIDELLKGLEKYDPNRRDALMSRLHWTTMTAAVLPIIMTGISAYLFFLVKEAITAVANAFDVIPPLFITKAKSDIDDFNKGAQIKYDLTSIKWKVNRLALEGNLEGQVVKEIEAELKNLKGV
jgi:hypothetical protein